MSIKFPAKLLQFLPSHIRDIESSIILMEYYTLSLNSFKMAAFCAITSYWQL